MIRTLTIVTVAAFFLSVVCLAAAVAIGGPELVSNGAWAWGPWSHSSSVHWSHTYADSDSARREMPWDAEKLMVSIPADVVFTQAAGPGKVVITGPKAVIDRLVVDGGGIHPDRTGQGDTYSEYRDVRVEVTAPKVTDFAMHGSGNLDIRDYSQDRLTIGVFGSNDVEAHGAAKRVDLTIAGSGNADLSQLATDAASVSISGSGEAKVGPKNSAKLDISGSGDVTLLSHPPHLESHVSGSGSINQDDSAAPATRDQPEKPAKPAKAGKKA